MSDLAAHAQQKFEGGPDKQRMRSILSKPISQLNTAQELTEKVNHLRRQRSARENRWKLSNGHYKGVQYSYINRVTNRIMVRPTDESDLPRFRRRVVDNKLQPGVDGLLAKMTKTSPIMSATPGSGSDTDYKSAELAQQLLEFWWTDLELKDKYYEALKYALIMGQGFWKPRWDQHAGKELSFILDPYSGQPIVDDNLAKLVKQNMLKQGVQPQEQTVYLGDVDIEVLSPFQVFLDPAAKTMSQIKWYICVHNIDPDEALARYGVALEPTQTELEPSMSAPMAGELSAIPTLCRVYELYQLPTPAAPKGRYVAWTDKPPQDRDGVLTRSDWPYPLRTPYLVKFGGIRVPGEIYDGSVVEQAIPLQKLLNRTKSQIAEINEYAANRRLLVPSGSQRTKSDMRVPGAIIEYNPSGPTGAKPEWEQPPQVPQALFIYEERLENSIKEKFTLTEIDKGQVPPNVEAGIAIELLSEMSTEAISPTILMNELALARAGKLLLSLAQKYYIEPRMLKIKGDGDRLSWESFSGAQLDGGVDIVVEAGSGLPRTRAGRELRIMRLVTMGVIAPEEAALYTDLADLKGIQRKLRAAEDQAMRENDKLVKGGNEDGFVILNGFAYQTAEQALAAGLNPETQQEIVSPDEALEALKRAALQPGPADNHTAHMTVHADFMVSPEFERLPLDVQERFIVHYQLHQSQLPQPEKANERTQTQVKLGVGPTAGAKLLRGEGETITAEDLQEPPLITDTYDSVDKADVDGGAPGQVGMDQLDLRLKLAQLRKAEAEADRAEREAKGKDS